ncbi:MAG: hypothetical protein V4692_02595 [Bdellovibrionota bacterium]
MKRLNQNGSVLLIVLVAAAVCAAIIGGMMARFGDVARLSKNQMIARENVRVGDELAKLVSKAYENQLQRTASGLGACPAGLFPAIAGGGNFCFPPDISGVDMKCVEHRWGKTCVELTGAREPKVITQNDREYFEFHAVGEAPSLFNARLSLLIPAAHAQEQLNLGRPVGFPAWATPNTYAAVVCDGSAGDADICKECGVGQNRFICFDIKYCPVNNAACAANQILSTGVMISR